MVNSQKISGAQPVFWEKHPVLKVASDDYSWQKCLLYKKYY